MVTDVCKEVLLKVSYSVKTYLYLMFANNRDIIDIITAYFSFPHINLLPNGISGKLFEDDDFPACDASIDGESSFSLEESSKWLRPKVIKILILICTGWKLSCFFEGAFSVILRLILL